MSVQEAVLLVAALGGWFVAGIASAAAILVWALTVRGKRKQWQVAESPDAEFDVEELLKDMAAGLPKITDKLNEALEKARAEALAIGEPAQQMLARLEEQIEQEREQWGQNMADAYAAGMYVESEYWTGETGELPPF